MLRLFKIVLVATILAGIYYYLQHTPFITTTWQRSELSPGVTLAFPGNARHHTRTLNSAVFGSTLLDVYDLVEQHEAYICLRIRPRHDQSLHRNLAQLLDEIRRLNDTASMSITLRKEFIYHGYPVYEYHATENDQHLWVRLLKLNGEILSLIYAVKDQADGERQAELFFNSLKL